MRGLTIGIFGIAMAAFTQTALGAVCRHDTAQSVEIGTGAAAKTYCVYLLNLYGPDVARFQQDLNEEDIVRRIVGWTDPKSGKYYSPHRYARFLQVAPNRVWDERVSTDGAIMLRAFRNGVAVPVSTLASGKLRIKIGDKSEDVAIGSPGESQVVYMRDVAGGAEVGAQLGVSVLLDPKPGASEGTQAMLRYSWFRPRTTFAVDYSILNFGVVMDDWCRKKDCELSIVPASMRFQYRIYGGTGGWYLFPGLFVGPNLAITNSDAATTGTSKKAPRINGLLFGGAVNMNGFEVGFGGLWDWEQPKLSPVLLLSISDAVWKGLGLSGKFPGAIAQSSDD